VNAREPAIVLDRLTKRFGTHAAVDGLSLSVEPGSIFGFLGPNGSGKSTTIKMLCGLLRPSSGDAHIDGHDVITQTDLVRRSIGYMAQGFALYGDLTVDENLEFFARAYGLGHAIPERKREVIEIVGIGAYRNFLAATLSGGWQRRLALAAALIHDPPVVFLDEPTSGIDPVARRNLWDLLFRLTAAGKTFFVTTHYMDEAERCSSLAYIFDGKLLASGSPDAIRSLAVVTPAGTRRYTIATDDVMETYRRIGAFSAVKDATIFGRDIHVMVDAATTPEQIAQAVGIAIERIVPVTASLEDAFVALTRANAA
jgi:ABC-type multidrug transport system ATPase subunit